ncbi:hypothetical protein [Streptomyces sparsogenes]|uniref:Uncharacterized protein n=1 Tax=Streptomyces sparsogenes DSM 40356 TaxID=1331668 RepID=A0A1R1SB83_9ACTN|nr:hypothetical protein [Streptomyces sparsogenes]OMI35467.1 hypothetical protein SPAR_31076 [Streptomyces sparsogenes DSM 40356]
MSVINDIDVQALQDTTAAVRASPQLGQATFSVNGSWQGGCRLTAQTGALTQRGERDDTPPLGVDVRVRADADGG